ncbi:MAG: ACP S-malonyltransferase [Burkholderiaceae bacterium]
MKLACVFPGQGSQAVGMLADFLAVEAVSQLVAAADESLPLTDNGQKLSALIANGPAEDLALTVNTQPAMLLAGVGCYRAWLAAGGPPAQIVAGHSLGEYSALVVAQVLEPGAAFALTRLRAQAMQSAVPVGMGSMAAILGLDDDSVAAVCSQAATETKGQVAPANFNAPSQVVIAGHSGAVTRACELAKEAGAKRALPLSVSAPFHSALLKPAGDQLQTALDAITLKTPEVPVVNNVDVSIESDPLRIRDALVRQAYSPVRWVEVVQKLREQGATHVIEFGPGKVLTGLCGRIDKSLTAACVFDSASLDKALAMLRDAT